MLDEKQRLPVVQYAGLFAKEMLRDKRLSTSMHYLSNCIGQPHGIAPHSAPLNLKGPTSQQVMRHVELMFNDIEMMDDPLKSVRWIGFAAGAAAAIGRPPSYLVSDQSSGWDLDSAVSLAKESDNPKHFVAHIILGYMQGWLWAFGHASIDDFRVMNKPDAKRTASA